MNATAETKNSVFTDLDYHLDNWARWMRAKELPEGLPAKASGGLRNFTSMDSYQNLAAHELWLAEHSDAAINDLVPAARAAIYVAYELAAVWRFPRDNYDDLLGMARARVRATLLRRGVVVT